MRKDFVSVGIRVYCPHAICPSHRAYQGGVEKDVDKFPFGPQVYLY